MKKITLYLVLTIGLLLSIKPSFADDCLDISTRFEVVWSYSQSGEDHVIEFKKDNNHLIHDGTQKEMWLCSFYSSRNRATFYLKNELIYYGIQTTKQGENLDDENIKLSINFKDFDLVPYQTVSNELLSENNLAAQNGFNWQPEVGFDGHIFPSLLISTATWSSNEGQKRFSKAIKNAEYLGDLNSPVKVKIRNIEAESKVRLEVDLGSIASSSVFEGILHNPDMTYVIKPRINFNYQALLSVKQPMPLNAKLTLYINDEKVGEKLQAVTIRSINDAPISARVGEKGEFRNDYSYVFAAYVNENNPLIDLLLREAIDTGVVDSFTGYQRGEQEVYKQVFSIWNVLQRRGLRYSSIATATGTSEKVFSQYVRFFDDAIATSQANCIDGTVLIASILRRAGINPKIVIVPGHAFLAFDLDESGKKIAFLETTMMGLTDLQRYGDGTTGIAGDVARLLGKTKNQVSQKSYIAALREGSEKANLARSKFLSKNPQYKIIDIEAARKMGITPINR